MDLYTARKLHSAIKAYLFIYSKCFLYENMSARVHDIIIFASSYTPTNKSCVTIYFAVLSIVPNVSLKHQLSKVTHCSCMCRYDRTAYKVLRYFTYRHPVI